MSSALESRSYAEGIRYENWCGKGSNYTDGFAYGQSKLANVFMGIAALPPLWHRPVRSNKLKTKARPSKAVVLLVLMEIRNWKAASLSATGKRNDFPVQVLLSAHRAPHRVYAHVRELRSIHGLHHSFAAVRSCRYDSDLPGVPHDVPRVRCLCLLQLRQ